jgi:REP element-mobilizing transposase RayT
MAHKFPNLLVHCVFSTKGRRNLIPETKIPNLCRYIHGIGRNHRIDVLSAGGTPNHLHLLISLPSDISVADALRVLKSNSSRWLREQGIDFAWQEGYGAFSVSASQKEIVQKYIEKQPEHHCRRSFEDEFVGLLRKTGMSYDAESVFG